jgi:hypothetical protein
LTGRAGSHRSLSSGGDRDGRVAVHQHLRFQAESSGNLYRDVCAVGSSRVVHARRGYDRRQRALAAILLALSSALISWQARRRDGALRASAIGALAVLLSRGRGGNAAAVCLPPHWQVWRHFHGTTLARVPRDTGAVGTACDQPYVQFARRRKRSLSSCPLAPGPLQPDFTCSGSCTVAAIGSQAAAGAPCCAGVRYRRGRPRDRLWRPAGFGIVRIPLLGNIGHINDVFLAAALPPLLILGGSGQRSRRERPAQAFVCVAVGAASWWLWTTLAISHG